MPSIDIFAEAATGAESVAASYGSDSERPTSFDRSMETPYLLGESHMPFSVATKGMAGWIGSVKKYENHLQFNSQLLVPNNAQEADCIIQGMNRAFGKKPVYSHRRSRLNFLTAAMRDLEELEVGQSSFTLSQPLEILHRRQLRDALCGSHNLDREAPMPELAGPSLMSLQNKSGPYIRFQKEKNVAQRDLEEQRQTDRSSNKSMSIDDALSYALLVSAVSLGIILSLWFWAC